MSLIVLESVVARSRVLASPLALKGTPTFHRTVVNIMWFKIRGAGFGVQFSPFVADKVAVCTGQNFGIVGRGYLAVFHFTPTQLTEVLDLTMITLVSRLGIPLMDVLTDGYHALLYSCPRYGMWAGAWH